MPSLYRQPVLVVLRSDGFVEVYADRTVDILVVNEVEAQHRWYEKRADDLTYDQIPERYQRLYAAWSLRGTGIHPATTRRLRGK